MAITFRGVASTPADIGTNTSNPTVVTPVSGMQAGDLCILIADIRATSASPAMSQTGGQTWASETTWNQTNCSRRIFWCTFNGTWSASPSVTNSGSYTAQVVMLVFIPTASNYTWAKDTGPTNAAVSAPGSPYNISIASWIPAYDSNVSIAMWAVIGPNTFGTLTGTNWVKTSLGAQYRNTSGSGLSSSFAYQIQTSHAATNAVAQNESAGTAGAKTYVTFYESPPDSNTYFGVQTDKSTPAVDGWDYNAAQTTFSKVSYFTCPGTGNKNLMALYVWACSGGGTPAHFRLAIYDNQGTTANLIAQGSAEILVNSLSPAWLGHTAFTDSAGNPISPILVGGTAYRIVVSTDGSDCEIGYKSGTSGDWLYDSGVDETGGYPATYAVGSLSNSSYDRQVICGIIAQPAYSAASVVTGAGTITPAAQKGTSAASTATGAGTSAGSSQKGASAASTATGAGTSAGSSQKGASAASTSTAAGTTTKTSQKGALAILAASIAGIIAALGFAGHLALSTITGAGSLAITGQKTTSQVSVASGSGGLSVTYTKYDPGASESHSGPSSITGGGQIIVLEEKGAWSTLAVSGEGIPSALGKKTAGAEAALSATGSQSAGGEKGGASQAIIAAGGTQSSLGEKENGADSLLSAQGSISITQEKGGSSPFSISAGGEVSTVGEAYIPASNAGAAVISSGGSIAAIGKKDTAIAIFISGSGSIISGELKSTESAASITSSGSVAPIGEKTPGAAAAISGDGEILSPAAKSGRVICDLHAGFGFSTTAEKGVSEKSNVAGSGLISETAIKSAESASSISAGGSLVVEEEVIFHPRHETIYLTARLPRAVLLSSAFSQGISAAAGLAFIQSGKAGFIQEISLTSHLPQTIDLKSRLNLEG